MATTQSSTSSSHRIRRILILGGGYTGLYAARSLRKALPRDQAEIALIDPRSYLTYQPFLPEAAAGSLEPSHVVTPHRSVLRDCTIITGNVSAIRHADRRVVVQPLEDGEPYELSYDDLVVGLGSVARTLPIPGLAEQGIGFKHVEEAMALRNQVLGKLDVAASTWDHAERRRKLTFVFVGGGYAGIEALGEIEDMAKAATREFDSITPEDLRFVLVEGTGRILPEVGEELGGYAIEQLRERGVDLRLNTFLESCVDGVIKLSDGEEFESDTVVWTAGVKANPVLQNSDLPLVDGRVRTDATLRVCGDDGPLEGVWAGGDCAAVPDLAKGGEALCGPTAQHAVRHGKHIGRNLLAAMQGAPLIDYQHENIGTVATLGFGKGIANIGGWKIRGPIAWFMHRSYHMWAMPGFNRKIRVVLDWTTSLFFKRETVALGSLQTPRESFVAAAATHGTAAAAGEESAAP